MGGLIVSAFIHIPIAVCYLLAGAAIAVEGVDTIENW
jgi:hypothetical protein